MDYTPITPFRRPVDAALLKHQAALKTDLPSTGVNKWEALRELAAARLAFGLSDRDLSVLQALVSFHQATILGGNSAGLVVYPSNRTICERLNGMACSTMRRHLSKLVQAGFVLRRDSPNGKRYVRRYGDAQIAFGFDLAPLVHRFAEICAAAESVRAENERHTRLRTTVSLMRRDLVGLVEYGRSLRPDLGVWDQASDLAALTARDLRRKLALTDLQQIETALSKALTATRHLLEHTETTDLGTNPASTEQHYQNSDKDSHESESCLESTQPDLGCVETPPVPAVETDLNESGPASALLSDNHLPSVPLNLVLASCSEVQTFTDSPVRHWHDLVRIADIVRPMMGISPSAWDDAKRDMGPEQAAVVISAMLERFTDIRSPGGYLRSLTAKAASGEFSCGPMIMALMRKDAA